MKNNINSSYSLRFSCILPFVACSASAALVRINFSATVSSISAPFVSEPLFQVGSTIDGYYIYNDSTPKSGGNFPALVLFEATLTRSGTPIFMSSNNGAVWLTDGGSTDTFRIDANVPDLNLSGAYINGLSLYARSSVSEFTSGSSLSAATPGILQSRFAPYTFSLQAPSGSFYGIEASGTFTYAAIPEPSTTATYCGLTVLAILAYRRRHKKNVA